MKALEELGLDPSTATEADVKSCFKQMAMKYHPDKGGDPVKFKQAVDLRDRALSELEHGATMMQAKLQMEFRQRRRPVCTACDGTGYRRTESQGFQTLKFKCRKCNGRGWLRE